MSETNVAVKNRVTDSERFQRAKFIGALGNDFKLYLIDCVMDGMADDFEDHFEFMEHALETFIDLSNSKEEE